MSESRTLPKLIAHRGGRRWAPENTMAAFKLSLDLGVDGIELDVQRCQTGELVVIHDADLARTTNGVGLIKDVSYDEIRRLSAGSWFAEEFADERVPLLSEVLDLVDGRAMVNVEIKNTPQSYPGIEQDVLAVLESYAHPDTIIVSSFDHNVMKRLKECAPDLKLALLGSAVFVDVGDYAAKLGATFFHPEFDCLNAQAVHDAHAAGLTINAWTLNDPRDWSQAVRWSIDGIVTDDPEGLHQFLHHVSTLTNQPS